MGGGCRRRQVERPVPGHDQVAGGRLSKLRCPCLVTGILCALKRGLVVVGEQLGVVGDAGTGQLLEPARGRQVLGCPRLARQRPIGDVTEQSMPERILVLVGN